MDNVDLNFRMMASGNAVPELRKAQNGVKNLSNQIDRSQARMRGFNNGITTMQANTRKFAMGGLQQAGYQIGDYAVQVANGTSKMQAFGQQAPQFLQIFGPIGAIVGAGVAIFSAFAVAIQRSKAASEELVGKVKPLSDAISSYRSAADLASMSTDELKDKFGEAAQAAADLFNTKAQIAQLEAIDSLISAGKELQSVFGVEDIKTSALTKYSRAVEHTNLQLNSLRDAQQLLLSNRGPGPIPDDVVARATEYGNKIRQLEMDLAQLNIEHFKAAEFVNNIAGQFGLLDSEALVFAKTLTNIVDAARTGVGDEMVSAIDAARAQFDSFVESNENLSPVQRAVLKSLLDQKLATFELIKVGTELENGTKNVAKAVEFVESNLSQATAQARELAKAIANAPLALKSMQDQTLIIEAELSAIKSGYTQIEASSAAYRKQRELELGLSEAGSAAEQAYLSAIINKDVKSFEARARANAELVKARKAFDELSNSGSSAISKLTNGVNGELSPAMKRLKSIQDTVSSSFENGFMSIVDGTKSVKDAFKSMASEIIKELYRIFVVKRITGMIGGFFNMNQVSGPSMPLGTGNIRPVMRPPRADGGGYTGNGARAGGLDGKGGFMAMIHPRETVVDHTKGQSMGGVTVIQNNTFQSGVTRSEVSALLPKMVEASKAAVLDAKRQGGSYGKAFA